MPDRVRAFLERLQWFKDTPPALAAVMLTCVGGVAYGVYYYLLQFQLTPAWLWPVVPDSPLAVLWAFLALGLHAAGRRSDALDGLAFVGNVQVGLWSAFVLLAYWETFAIYELNVNFLLFWLHIGMVVLALLFVRDLARRLSANPRRKWVAFGVPAAYYLGQNVLDYAPVFDLYGTGCGLRPITVPCDAATEPVLMGVTFALTLGSLGALWWLTRAAAPPGDAVDDARTARPATEAARR